MASAKNKTKELVKKLKKAINRLLAPEQDTPALILIPVRQQRRF